MGAGRSQVKGAVPCPSPRAHPLPGVLGGGQALLLAARLSHGPRDPPGLQLKVRGCWGGFRHQRHRPQPVRTPSPHTVSHRQICRKSKFSKKKKKEGGSAEARGAGPAITPALEEELGGKRGSWEGQHPAWTTKGQSGKAAAGRALPADSAPQAGGASGGPASRGRLCVCLWPGEPPARGLLLRGRQASWESPRRAAPVGQVGPPSHPPPHRGGAGRWTEADGGLKTQYHSLGIHPHCCVHQ